MTRKRKMIVLAIIGVLAIAAAAVAGLVRLLPRHVGGIPPSMIPAAWEEFRTSPGHTTHVEKNGIACKSCHDYEKVGFVNPGPAPCTKCHEKEVAHAHKGTDEKAGCLSCHAFAPKQESPTCIGCHSQAQGHLAALGPHKTTDCKSCHVPHGDPPIVAKDCATSGCHGERSVAHAKHAGSKGCLDCHKGHAPAKDARVVCATCHEKPAGPKPAGHDSCVDCHKPHDFVAGGASACVGCHGAKPTLLADRAPAHAVCTSCHTPHAPAGAAAKCSGCHAGVRVSHAGKDACVECHVPHGGNTNATASTCTSCHSKVATSDKGAHGGGLACKGCHQPHDFTPPAAAAKVALCTSCHASETALTASSKGHRDCASCHGTDTHRPTAGPSCASCHKTEAATAPSGHQKCASCHQPHSGARIATATCTSCHANKTHGAHVAFKGGCEGCHRAHGPSGVASPAACASCHQRATLPALHAKPSHATCSSCHSSHGPTRADRVTCTGSCHVDKRNHQPQAAVCNGCHGFR